MTFYNKELSADLKNFRIYPSISEFKKVKVGAWYYINVLNKKYTYGNKYQWDLDFKNIKEHIRHKRY